MLGDKLFEYLSDVGTGDWELFRRGYDWLAGRMGASCPPISQLAMDLSALGHLEVTLSPPGQWSVSPPTLATLPGDALTAVLCGGRTPDLLERVLASSRTLGASLEIGLSYEHLPQVDLVHSDSEDVLQKVAFGAGLEFSRQFSRQLSNMLPHLDSILDESESAIVLPSPNRCRLDLRSGRWLTNEDGDGNGLYRYRPFSWQFEFRLALGEKAWRVPLQLGVYLALEEAKLQLMHYEEHSSTLSVPMWARPPALFDRALTLCSGRPPTRESNTLRFTEVPADIAHHVCNLLGQALGRKDAGSANRL